eukprot:12052238-Alexandrium_andersonii.AAC.1
MPVAPVPYVLAFLPGEPVDYALHATLESEEVPQVRHRGTNRLRGPKNDRADSSVEQSKPVCRRGEPAVEDVR